ncbi:MAG TPA: hypothetical protein VFP46_00370 [Candidatus Paceibacterota bacterium]|nr:hypothetical protein [Candidatus Paceibacterota bacterium]
MNLIKSSIVAGVVGSLALAPVAFADQHGQPSDMGTRAASAPSVSINGAGHVFVRGASVTGVTGSTVTASSSWGSASITWNVNVASSTEILGQDGRMTLAGVKSGDVISFQGPIAASSTSAFSVDARVIRDGSAVVAKVEKPEKHRSFEGKLQAISGNTLTLRHGEKTITVDVASTTQVKRKNAVITDLATLHLGDKIRVSGTGSTTISATTVRDSSR